MYAFQFLVKRSEGVSMADFMKAYTEHDYVRNDQIIASWFRKKIVKTIAWLKSKKSRGLHSQSNVRRV